MIQMMKSNPHALIRELNMDDATSYHESKCYESQTGAPSKEPTKLGEHLSEHLNAMRHSLAKALYASRHANFHL